MRIIVDSYKALRKLKGMLFKYIYTPIAKLVFILNGISYGKGLRVMGLMKIFVTRRGVVKIGNNFKVNSGENYNIIGRQQKSTLWVEGELVIKDDVGMSSSVIICNHQITIGNNVVIGGNTVIYDTDFHSIVAELRNNPKLDRANTRWAPVSIGDNVFIGAHTTILKGVSIGDNAVIGACSVVSKNIPDNEIWAGNPAVFIKKCSSSPSGSADKRGDA